MGSLVCPSAKTKSKKRICHQCTGRFWKHVLTPIDYRCSTVLPPSSNHFPLLGLSLLRLLSSNQIGAFHTTLETLSAELVRDNPFLAHPVSLERWLMEGSYSKVWRARREVPREEYAFFVDSLMGTIR